ncbi:beta-ketoacyl reductase, partial [Streptomyces asiaticus]
MAPGLTGTLTLLQALVDAAVTVPLWCATRGAVAIDDAESPDAPHQAQLWGLGRVAALEHPDRWGGLVDLPASPDTLDAERLRALLTGARGEDEVALRPAGAYGRRLVPDPIGGRAPRRTWKPRGTVLITGTADGPAAQVARHLAADGAEHIVMLCPGGGEAPGAVELTAELDALGTGLTVADHVPADREATARLVERVAEENGRIGTIIHTSASGELAPLMELTPRRLAGEIRAHLDDTGRYLDELCGMGPEDTVVYFSTVAASWGSKDHGSYAAATACLDALARHDRADGRPTVSIAWGLWDLPYGGAAADATAASHTERSRRQGLPPLDPRPALTALRQALDHDDPGGGGTGGRRNGPGDRRYRLGPLR